MSIVQIKCRCRRFQPQVSKTALQKIKHATKPKHKVTANDAGKKLTCTVTAKSAVGTGLGLWVTRGFVEKQGGSIHFRSRTNPPSGTTFRVVLPVHMPVANHPGTAASDLPV